MEIIEYEDLHCYRVAIWKEGEGDYSISIGNIGGNDPRKHMLLDEARDFKSAHMRMKDVFEWMKSDAFASMIETVPTDNRGWDLLSDHYQDYAIAGEREKAEAAIKVGLDDMRALATFGMF